MSNQQYLAYLVETAINHGNLAYGLPDGNLRVREVFTQNGRVGRQWVTLPPKLSVLKEWLGY